MENRKYEYEHEMDELIRASMELKDVPSPELNERLIASLYKQEAVMRQAVPVRSIPLWFVPMILNFVTFSLLSVLAILVIANPYLAKLTAGICAYISIAGILITVVGVKRTDMKETIAVHVQKRGILE